MKLKGYFVRRTGNDNAGHTLFVLDCKTSSQAIVVVERHFGEHREDAHASSPRDWSAEAGSIEILNNDNRGYY